MQKLFLKKGISKKSAYNLRNPKDDEFERHTLAILVDNESGVLARVIGLFAARGFNIDSLTVSETESKQQLSRITLVTSGSPSVIEKIKVQVDRLVSVHRVADLTADYGQYGALERELALIKVKGTGNKRLEALRLAEAFDAQTVDASLDSFVFQITGRTREIDRFINLMASVGLTEVSRTGVAALKRGAGST